MDTINSTLAHGPQTRLPPAFYDSKGREIIERIGVEEWFAGFQESNEYRTVGIGGLAGDIVARMVGTVEDDEHDGGDTGFPGSARGCEKKIIRFALSGCHDTTLAAMLASLGCLEGETWPPYTSHIAFELFKTAEAGKDAEDRHTVQESVSARTARRQDYGRLGAFLGSGRATKSSTASIARKSTNDLHNADKEKLNGHYVRVRYNDRALVIPGCRLPGNHLDLDESFCTLVSIPTRLCPDPY